MSANLWFFLGGMIGFIVCFLSSKGFDIYVRKKKGEQ